MGKTFKQFRLLLWKNFLIQKRRPISSVVEILLPIFFVALLLIIRITSVSNDQQKPIHWPSFSIGPLLPKQVNDRSNLGTNTLWTIAYAPNDTQFFHTMHSSFPMFLKGAQVEAFETDSEMLAALKIDMDNDISQQKYLCGVVFLSEPGSSEIKYQLRFPPDARSVYIRNREERLGSKTPNPWFTESVFPRNFRGTGARENNSEYGGQPYYYEEGFTTVQRAVEFSIIRNMKGNSPNSLPDIENLYVQMERFPYPEVVIDGFIGVIQSSLPLVLMLSLVYTALNIVKNIVHEKEKKLKVRFFQMVNIIPYMQCNPDNSNFDYYRTIFITLEPSLNPYKCRDLLPYSC